MPANLTPQYYEAEKKYRATKSPVENTRLSRLTQQLSKKSGGSRSSMTIDKEGAAQVAVTGLPNSGKSLLVDILTSAAPVVAAYPLTTQVPLPGMMDYEDIKVQLIDTPPLAPQTIQWWLPPLLRQVEALILTIDISFNAVARLEETIDQLNKMRIYVGKKAEETEFTTWYKSALLIATNTELDKSGKGLEMLAKYGNDLFPIAPFVVGDDIGTTHIKKLIYQMLGIIRVYTKAPGKKPDFSDPIVVKKGSTLLEAAVEVHKDFASNLRYARIWGSGKHNGVMVKRDHILKDRDIIELHLGKEK